MTHIFINIPVSDLERAKAFYTGLGAGINPQNVIRNAGNEFHPGAVRYYQQIGVWPR